MSTAAADTTVAENAPPALKPPVRPFIAALHCVENDLSHFGAKPEREQPLESMIRACVEAAGGVVLFHMQVGEPDAARVMAAVAFGEADAREIAVIDVPSGGGAASVSPATESDLPIAAIASAYAGLAECWKTAA